MNPLWSLLICREWRRSAPQERGLPRQEKVSRIQLALEDSEGVSVRLFCGAGAENFGQELLGHNLRTKLRTRSTKEALEGAADLGAFVAAGGGVTEATATPSTRPWKMSVGRTRTRRTRAIILGSTSGWTLTLAS